MCTAVSWMRCCPRVGVRGLHLKPSGGISTGIKETARLWLRVQSCLHTHPPHFGSGSCPRPAWGPF